MYIVVQDESNEWLRLQRMCSVTTHIVDTREMETGLVGIVEILFDGVSPSDRFELAQHQCRRFQKIGMAAQTVHTLEMAKAVFELVIQGKEVLPL